MSETAFVPPAHRLEGRICLITGGVQGFGASIVSLFVAHGAKCLVLDLLVPSGAIAEGGEEGEGGGGWYDPFTIASPFPPSSTSSFNAALNAPEKSAYALRADITSRTAWQSALRQSIHLFNSPPTIIVNNAGWTYSNQPTLNVTEDDFAKVFDINVKSIFLSVDVLLPTLLEKGKTERGDAVWINVSSTAALRPRPGLVWCKLTRLMCGKEKRRRRRRCMLTKNRGYAFPCFAFWVERTDNASKAAVSNATKALAVEYAAQGVRFNTVCPVAGNTPL